MRKKNRTLLCFVEALQGQEVIVELRYDTVIRGVLESSDEALNLVITDATARPLQAKPPPYFSEWLLYCGVRFHGKRVRARANRLVF